MKIQGIIGGKVLVEQGGLFNPEIEVAGLNLIIKLKSLFKMDGWGIADNLIINIIV